MRYPREVETALERHPSVAEAAVTDVPSPEGGEEAAAWIVPRGPATSEDLLKHVGRLLSADDCPKRIRLAHALPRDGAGAVDRSALVAETRPPDTTGVDRAIAKLWKADLS